MLNGMTVDVEEHFQASAFDCIVDRGNWGKLDSRVEANTERVLDLLDEANVTATFFVLGWLADRRPALVRRIADRGHEIASHGYSHLMAHEQTRQVFRDETIRSRRILQDASGQPVAGYRAASFSIGRRNLWALDILAEAGFLYDSSIFPVRHDRYGMPGASRRIHRLATPSGHTLIEVPPSCLAWRRWTLPICGGGYLRLYPAALTFWSIRHFNRREARPAIVYVHPWEFDPDQPRLRAPMLTRFRHYTGLHTTETKLRNMMARYSFGPLREVIQQDSDLGRKTPGRATAAAGERR
jgi:polysaccharide deacetylase family protein (PEP-CTERM system associated)